MSYRLTITEKPSYLHAVVTGPNTKKTVRDYLDELLQESIKRGCSRLLIEERLKGRRLDMADVFRIADESSVKAHGRFEAIAFVDVNARGDMMKFAETVAVNRGLPVTVFPTVAAAEKWLLEKQRESV